MARQLIEADFVLPVVTVGLAAILFLQTVTDELTPGMRQCLEEVLVDTANLLAELAGGPAQQCDVRGWMASKTSRNLVLGSITCC